MNIVADESVDYGIILELRNQGFEIYSILENDASIADDQVLDLAYSNEALLLTEDKDFGELAFRLRKPHRGIILLRLAGLSGPEKNGIVIKNFIDRVLEFRDSFTVITPDKLRVKKKAS